MPAEIAANYILNNTAAITTLVGSGVNARIYYGLRLQTSVMPALLLEPDGTDPTDQKPDTTGTGEGRSRLDREDVLVFCYGKTYTEAYNLAQAVKSALDKKSGGTYDSISVQSIQFISDDYFNEQTEPVAHVFEHRYRLRIVR
jgi:hypothetical protein